MARLDLAVRGRPAQRENAQQDLEIVVPFTTPDLTRAALRDAETYAAGLAAHVYLIKVQIVPFPLDLSCPPVSLDFLREQLESMSCELPVTCDVHVARDLPPAVMATLTAGCITVLTSKRRPWRTREEKLAATLRRAGHHVLIRDLERKNA